MNDGSTQAYVAPTAPVLDRMQAAMGSAAQRAAMADASAPPLDRTQAAMGSAAQRAQIVQVLGGSYVSGLSDDRIPGRYTDMEAARR
jgi:hypothetical protein